MSFRRRAFTLVELLVVIGIITVLIAVLLPALGKVRKYAQEVHCAAHLRTIGQGLMMYTQQFGFYPGSSYGEFAVWAPRVRLFLGGDSRVFYCPAQDERCEWKQGGPTPGGVAIPLHTPLSYVVGDPLIAAHATFFSYGYNWRGVGNNGDVVMGEKWFDGHLGLGEHIGGDPTHFGRHRELRATRVKVPPEMIAVSDSGVDGVFDAIIHSRWTNATLAFPTPPGPAHRGGANVLFCDGHVQWYALRDIVVLEGRNPADAAIRRMWNNDHEPHFER